MHKGTSTRIYPNFPPHPPSGGLEDLGQSEDDYCMALSCMGLDTRWTNRDNCFIYIGTKTKLIEKSILKRRPSFNPPSSIRLIL